ncbi:hypothetical protein [uncultured Hymenobacter sp.]|uniref:hypothetical protein n=1 Tax=uncultured Hymenobacter sp. TaxID=170016 RepID=UPI0035C984D0
MATTRKQGATDQTQDAANNQQDNHAQTPDQGAANSGAFAQSSYQNTQQQSGTFTGGQDTGAESRASDSSSIVDTAVQAGKKWLDESGVLKNANQLPQAAKEWGTKALGSVSALSTTQKVVGGALLLAGVAYLSTRGGKSKSKRSSGSDDEASYRSGGRSGNYRQGSWAGYAGGKSASRRNAESGSRSDVSSYGTERRATGGTIGGSGGGAYGRGASSSDNDFGSGGSGSSGYGSSQNQSDRGTKGGLGGSSQQGSYRSGSTYGSSSSASSSVGSGQGSSGGLANSNEQDYDTSL